MVLLFLVVVYFRYMDYYYFLKVWKRLMFFPFILEKWSSEKVLYGFARGQTKAMQTLTNAATSPSFAASVLTNCATETTPERYLNNPF